MAHRPLVLLFAFFALSSLAQTGPMDVLDINNPVTFTIRNEDRYFVTTVPGGVSVSIIMTTLNPGSRVDPDICVNTYPDGDLIRCDQAGSGTVVTTITANPTATTSYRIRAFPYQGPCTVSLEVIYNFISQNGVGFYRPAVGQPLTVGMLVPAGTNATVVMDNLDPGFGIFGSNPNICIVNDAGQTITCDNSPANVVRSIVSVLSNTTSFYRVVLTSTSEAPNVRVFMNYTVRAPPADRRPGTPYIYTASGFLANVFRMPAAVTATFVVTMGTADLNAATIEMNRYDADDRVALPLTATSNVSTTVDSSLRKTFVVSGLPGARFDLITLRDPTLGGISTTVEMTDIVWPTLIEGQASLFLLRANEEVEMRFALSQHTTVIFHATIIKIGSSEVQINLFPLDLGYNAIEPRTTTLDSFSTASIHASVNWRATISSSNPDVRVSVTYEEVKKDGGGSNSKLAMILAIVFGVAVVLSFVIRRARRNYLRRQAAREDCELGPLPPGPGQVINLSTSAGNEQQGAPPRQVQAANPAQRWAAADASYAVQGQAAYTPFEGMAAPQAGDAACAPPPAYEPAAYSPYSAAPGYGPGYAPYGAPPQEVYMGPPGGIYPPPSSVGAGPLPPQYYQPPPQGYAPPPAYGAPGGHVYALPPGAPMYGPLDAQMQYGSPPFSYGGEPPLPPPVPGAPAPSM